MYTRNRYRQRVMFMRIVDRNNSESNENNNSIYFPSVINLLNAFDNFFLRFFSAFFFDGMSVFSNLVFVSDAERKREAI